MAEERVEDSRVPCRGWSAPRLNLIAHIPTFKSTAQPYLNLISAAENKWDEHTETLKKM